jgi:hypothetical protein
MDFSLYLDALILPAGGTAKYFPDTSVGARFLMRIGC